MNIKKQSTGNQILIAICLVSIFSGLLTGYAALAAEKCWVNGQEVDEDVYKATVLTNEAITLRQEKNYDGAIQKLEEALNLSPTLLKAKFELANTYAQAGKCKSAEPMFAELLKQDDGAYVSAGLLWNYAYTARCVGKLAQAAWAYKEFLKRYGNAPNAKTAKDMLAKIEKELSAQGSALASPNQNDTQNSLSPDYFHLIKPISLNGKKAYPYFPKSAQPIKVYIDAEHTSKDSDQLEEMVIAGLDSWRQASNNLVDFEIISDPKDAQILCSFHDQTPAFFSPVELARTKRNSDDTKITRSQIFFLTQKDGKPIELSILRFNCLHEIGHALGLDGHSDNPEDIMYFSNNGDEISKGLVISKRDIATLKRLYAFNT